MSEKVSVIPAHLEWASKYMNGVGNDAQTAVQSVLSSFTGLQDALKLNFLGPSYDLATAGEALTSDLQNFESACFEFGWKLNDAAKAYSQGDAAVAAAIRPRT